MNPFPPVASGPGSRTAEADLTRRVQDLAGWAAATLGVPVDLAVPDPRDALEDLAAACLGRLREAPSATACRAVAPLLSTVTGLQDEVSERTMIARARRLAECERGLARLREITTTAGLIDGVCDELIRSLGFVRTMLARVEGGMWRPWKANAAMLDESWVAEWIEQEIPLDTLTLETRLLTDRRPALVLDTNVEGIAQIVHAAGVRSYVAAPIMPGDQVVGFFHADHGVGGRTCDEIDRDILWNFSEGFGHLYERTALLEQLHARTEQVRTTMSGLSQALDDLVDAKPTLVHDDHDDDHGAGPGSVVRHGGIGARLGQCTSRELEVLELLVAGARNVEIARRLAITQGTVKSHVRNILAKLDVLNRSQAIALYLGARSDDPPGSGVTPH